MIGLTELKLTQTYSGYGLHFAGPDLLDYVMIFYISGGVYHGDRLRIESSYHLCCGTLEINTNLMNTYKRWHNKLYGCRQHRREGGGYLELQNLIWNLSDLLE
ncbi:MAG: hypothetical protein U9R53_06985 [Chloroflexota bacterium]|nr:hypothetical protein [Chloroflexota bacterium]